MHFRLPKPLHGWREFIGEVGIIVIGVLIALGAEQVVEAWHDQRVAHETRVAITQEFDENLSSVQLRGTAEVCVARRLEELRSIVDRWGRTGTFPTPQWVSSAPSLTINLPNYDAANAAGRLALLPGDEQRQMGAVADALRLFDTLQEQQSETWADLRMLQSGADALSASDRSIVRQALQRAAYLDYRSRLVIRQLLPMAAGYGFRPDFRHFRERAKLIWKSGHYTPSICAPIETPPARANAMTGQQVPLPF